VMLANVVMEKESLPTEWADQAAIFYSWFESVGFNRYNGERLPQFIEDPNGEPVTITRTMKQELPVDVPPHRVPPQSAMDVLPKQKAKKAGAIDISFKDPHLPIGMRTKKCDANDPESYKLCGMAVADGDDCNCWNYVVPFNLETTLNLDKLMAMMKLPSRAFMYAQMKYWNVPIDRETVQFYCEPTQEDCSTTAHFSKNARVLQWSWFGKVTKYPVTIEGVVIISTLLAMITFFWSIVTGRFQRCVGCQKQNIRKFLALNKAFMANKHA
jgi:hypothetical protein